MKSLKIALLLVCLLMAANITLAQSTPTVEIVLSQSTAKQGDVITADVSVRNAVNIGGADIGMAVDDKCLKILDRQQGGFLPSTADGGSYSAFSELHDHDTRLAVAITDRSKLANADGVFFKTQIQVTCAQGAAPLRVTLAQLGAYKDPTAADIELIAYQLTDHTVTTIDALLTINPQDSGTVVQTVAPVADSIPQGAILMPVVLGVVCLAVICFILVLVVKRRRPNDD